MDPHPGDLAIGPVPDGHRYFRRSLPLAHAFTPGDPAADRAFERARAMLRAWGPQIGAGMRVEVASASASGSPDALLPAPEAGLEVRVTARLAGIVPVPAPVRIIAADFDEADWAGFAYEALPGHPETGREAFYVTRTDGLVEFTVTAFSKPATWYSRLGGPITRIVQNRYTNKYLLAMAIQPR
ncbi:MAG: DUF1990 domain-containing protein [Catenulispora sp.]|nr:DUF1990 domain-containing protein [Catenulispora sp.]